MKLYAITAVTVVFLISIVSAATVMSNSASPSLLPMLQGVPSGTVPAASTQNSHDSLTYHNATAGVSIKYPSTWHVNKEGATIGGAYSDTRALRVAAFFPVEPSPLSPGVAVFVENLKGHNVSLDTYSQLKLSSWQRAPSFKLLNSSTTTLAGHPARAYVDTFEYNGETRQVIHTITIVGNTGYAIDYSSPLLDYPTYLDAVNTMVNSCTINT